VNSITERRLELAVLIRTVEERLLRLFAEGKIAGTTHTCIGQELSAVMLAESLDRDRDIIFSNHRCHGHFVAWTGDVEGLIAEVMGRRTGACEGIGGSQHLCSRRFFSNGVQGGIVPVSAGLAYAQKLSGSGGIVTVCMGDGTLGEGVVYETFNMVSRWGLPLLMVLENNLYAQSTSQHETLAGNICERAASFGIVTYTGSTWQYAQLGEKLRDAAGYVRGTCTPAFVQVDTYRLAAHSKGDDDRDAAEIRMFAARDPVNEFLASLGPAREERLRPARARVEAAVAKAAAEQTRAEEPTALTAISSGALRTVEDVEPGTQLQAINRALRTWLAEDERVLILGEDVRAPYGGAFKVTQRLSDEFAGRVINTPISEAGIVGIGNGLALGGRRPIVEIMFGDFLGLCFDQLLNHAAKFSSMYAEQVSAPIVVRAPMGGGRGYGPTHSQNIEKHFVGVPGLAVAVLHGRTRIAALYRTLRGVRDPLLLIENKLLYKERSDAPLPPGYTRFESAALLPSTVLVPETKPDLTVVAFGRMSVLAEQAAALLAQKEEIIVELLFPLSVWPLDSIPIRCSTHATGRLLVVEEGAEGFDLASEVIATVASLYQGSMPLRVRRLGAHPAPIPSAIDLERRVLPNERDIFESCLELFDA
jgi:2-oxoisovalerate dehydrogenase E1 component